VKQVAVRQLAEGGPQAVSVNAIAKELGVSGPALYRYFAGRDDLLTELIVDAYRDFASALSAAIRLSDGQRAPERLRLLANSFRDWALAEPHRYRLLFTAPLPGYNAQSEQLVAASQSAMEVLVGILTGLGQDPRSSSSTLDGQLEQWSRSRGLTDVTPAMASKAVMIWARLHGLVTLEIEGNFASMGLDGQLLFDVAVDDLVDAWTRPRPESIPS